MAAAHRRGGRPYAGGMFWFLVLLVVVAIVAYKFRVPLLSKVLGQPESRVKAALDRRKGKR